MHYQFYIITPSTSTSTCGSISTSTGHGLHHQAHGHLARARGDRGPQRSQWSQCDETIAQPNYSSLTPQPHGQR